MWCSVEYEALRLLPAYIRTWSGGITVVKDEPRPTEHGTVITSTTEVERRLCIHPCVFLYAYDTPEYFYWISVKFGE